MRSAYPAPRRPTRRIEPSARLAGVRRLALLAGTVVVVVAGVTGLLHGDDDTPAGDPLAWRPGSEGELSRRAATGAAHPLYAHSPGGIVASAARTARWREPIEEAARAAGVDADTLEGLVLLESAGREDAVTPAGLEGAVGLTQILAETASNLLGMHVDLAASRRLERRIARAEHRGRHARAGALLRERARVDQRFDPRAALRGTARYLTQAMDRFGREDLAFVSYHMGMGNLEGVLESYGQGRVPYARLYFDSTPARHPATWRRLSRLGDDSANYLWKVLAGREVMRLWREDPEQLEQLAALQTAKASAEEVLHPPGDTLVFTGPDALRAAWDDGDIVAFGERDESSGLRRDRRMGELARRVGADADLYRGLRPEALAMLRYIGAQVRELSGGATPLIVTSTVRDAAYQRALTSRNTEATRRYSLHTTGWAFDVERRYVSRRQAVAFQFVLDRLQILGAIAWAREPAAIHITAAAAAP
jgi:hypothetical protein